MGRERKRTPACPRCGATDVLPIEYGLPGDEMIEAEQRGELVLGGCCITPDSPRWQCRRCGKRFRRGKPAPATAPEPVRFWRE